jgi:hypothetical protein
MIIGVRIKSDYFSSDVTDSAQEKLPIRRDPAFL